MVNREISPWDKIAGYVFGGIFLSVMLVLNVMFPHPSPTQQETFKIILALSAAGLGGILGGFLKVNGKVAKLSIRAGGALALFLVVFFISPSTSSSKTLKQPSLEIHQTMTGDGGTQVGKNSGTINIGNPKTPSTGTDQKQ